MLICQISDLHIKVPGALSYGVVDAAAYLRRCIAQVLAQKQRPDIVVITGDLVDFGRADEYAHLAELLQPLTMPVYLLPGNHDDRDTLRASFPGHDYLRQMGDFIQYAVDAGPLRILALDSVISGQSGGELCANRLAWLDDEAVGGTGQADGDPDASPAVCDRHRPHGPDRLREPRRPRADRAAASPGGTRSCAGICIARSRCASPAPSHRRARDPPTRSRWTSLPMRRRDSCSSRRAISCICGTKAAG